MGARPELKQIVVDDWILEVLIESTKTVFSTTFGLGVTLKEHKFESDSDDCIVGDVSGIIGIVQEAFEGNLIVSFPKEVLFAALKQVYGQEFDTINQSVLQGAGELTNMIFGQIKTKLNERGYRLQMALPNIIQSEDHKIHHLSGKQVGIVVMLLDERYSFRVSLVLGGN